MHSIPQLPCCTRALQYWTIPNQTTNNSDLQWQYILIWVNHFKTRCAIIETFCNFQNVSLTLMMQIWNTNSSRCFQHILNFIISYFKVTFILCWTVSAVLKFFFSNMCEMQTISHTERPKQERKPFSMEDKCRQIF